MPILLSFVLMTSLMNAGSLRQRLLAGGKSYGPFLMSDSPIIAELLATIGYGHVVIDHEHSVTDVRSGMRMLQALRSGRQQRQFGVPPDPGAVAAVVPPTTEAVVRVPSPNDPAYMKKVLDTLTLPGGIMVPMVESAEMARAVVQSTRYPLQASDVNDDDPTRRAMPVGGGIRGNAWPLARASLYGTHADYVDATTRDLLVMVQVETPKAVEAIPEIAQVPGVDAIFIGPLDLSTSMGRMGRHDDADVKQMIRRAEKLVLKSGCVLAGFRPPGRTLQDMFDAGYSFVAGSVDLGLLQEAARKDLAEANAAMGKTCGG